MKTYDTLSEAVEDLKKQGYTVDFNLAFDHVKCSDTGICLSPSQFEIVQFYRFEGMTNPSDSSILYVIESNDKKMKGLLVDAYGVYSGEISADMLQKLSVHLHNSN